MRFNDDRAGKFNQINIIEDKFRLSKAQKLVINRLNTTLDKQLTE